LGITATSHTDARAVRAILFIPTTRIELKITSINKRVFLLSRTEAAGQFRFHRSAAQDFIL